MAYGTPETVKVELLDVVFADIRDISTLLALYVNFLCKTDEHWLMHPNQSGQIIVPEPEAKHFAKILPSSHQQHGEVGQSRLCCNLPRSVCVYLVSFPRNRR